VAHGQLGHRAGVLEDNLDLLANTKLIGGGESAEVVFKAPADKGDYTFVCSFPSHFALGMKGTLTVK
jgi:azurin